ncbi:MAG: hypothetical protein JWR54_3591 [Mucilaginibacter sp.]|nr:hypothetical protein [Mucilaginibacter sp.]
MKYIYTISLIAMITIAMVSCSKSKVTPVKTSKVDTSTTLISSNLLVGNWNIVTDTISYNGNNIMYHGTATDHYKFTKYGNLYINEGLDNLTDTAVYAISSINNQVNWVNNYISVNGVSSTFQSVSLPFVITSVDNVSLVLTQSVSTSQGPRYEQIKFKK